MGALPPVVTRAPRTSVRKLVACAAIVVGAGACTPLRPTPAPTPAPTPVGAPISIPEKPVPVDPLAEPWLVGAPRAPITQTIEITTAVRAAATIAALETAPADSLRTALVVRWDSAGPGSIRAGSITSYRVAPFGAARVGPGAAGVMFTPPGITLPLAVAATLDAERGTVGLTAPAESSCGPDAAAAQVARELLFAAPRQLARGMSWVESHRATICRDSIPLALESRRVYTVEDARVQDGYAIVVVRRRSTMTLRGAGQQFGEPVTIAGEGEGDLLFGLRLDDGQMVDGNGVSTLRLTLSGRRKSQAVTQHARLEIRRAP